MAHMLTGGSNFKVSPQGTKARKDSTALSVAASAGAKAFEMERAAIYALLGAEQASGAFGGSPSCLISGATHDVMRIMTFAMCESLSANEAIVEAVSYAVPVDITALWSPDEAFFANYSMDRVFSS